MKKMVRYESFKLKLEIDTKSERKKQEFYVRIVGIRIQKYVHVTKLVYNSFLFYKI